MIWMPEQLQFTFIFYYLILPIVIGSGIESRVKNRYGWGGLCGAIFYVFVSFWTYFGISAELSVLEPIMISMAAGFSFLIIGYFLDVKGTSSRIQRHALVFLAVSTSGVALFAIKAIVDGTMGIQYPASVLPLAQFTLAIIGIVVVTNIFESKLYFKNEAKDKKMIRRPEDILDMNFDDMDDRDFDKLPLPQRGLSGPHNNPNVAHMDLKFDSEEVKKM